MEWSWRTILILIGLVAIAAIMIDGFRRMKRARAEALKFDLQPGADDLIDDDYNPELPGSVRVVSDSEPVLKSTHSPVRSLAENMGRTEPSFGDDDSYNTEELSQPECKKVEQSGHESLDITSRIQPSTAPPEPIVPDSTIADSMDDNVEEASELLVSVDAHNREEDRVAERDSDEVLPRSSVIPTAQPVDLDEQVPVLLDVEEFGDEGIISTPRVIKEESSAQSSSLRNTEPEAFSELKGMFDSKEAVKSEQTLEHSESTKPKSTSEIDVAEQIEELQEINDPHLDDEVEAALEEKSAAEDDTTPLPINYAGCNAEVLADRPIPALVLVIHALAKDHAGFSGHQLLHFFNSCDLRYGEKDIFHRFEEADGKGRIQFSVAQIENPGTFHPAHMSEQRFSGLSFFMSLPGAKRPLEAYEAMSEMAMAVARNLKADVLDESHSAMTPQTMEHERQQILEYERQQRLAAKKRQ